MAQAQTLDPKAFPDQGTSAKATPPAGGGLDPGAFPVQADEPKKKTEPKGILGDPRKPASIGPAGGVLYESVPLVTASAGGMLGGTAGAPGGPPGVAGGAVVGAGTGGMYGRYIQFLLRETAGKTKIGQDVFGIPPPDPSIVKETEKTAKQAGGEATTQMETEMLGQGVAAPLGWVRRGGFLKNNRQVMSTLREDRALGTRLSGPEIASGSIPGDIAKTIQSYSAGSFGGGPIQRITREKGTAAATKVIDDALSLLGHPGIKGGPTATSKGSAQAAREQVGKLLDFAADKAPPVDVTAVKQLAVDELNKGIVQHLKAVPDVANPKVAAIIRQLRNDPTLIQRLPRPQMLLVADAILEKHKSPTLQLLRRVVGMEDQTKARGLWEELKSLRAMSTPADELYAKDDKQRLATLFRGKLRESLNAAAPQFAQAMGQYRDLVRGDYLRENIILGHKPVPTSEADAHDILTGMAGRLRKAVESGRIGKDFNDPTGQKVITNLTRVASLLEKRTEPMAGNLRKIFEIGRIVSTVGATAMGHPTVGTTAAAITWEGFPDFFTWVIHDPQATKWFIEGVKADNPAVSTGAIIRLGELYRRANQPQQQGDGSTPAAGPQGKPSASNAKPSFDQRVATAASKATGIGPTRLDAATTALNDDRQKRGLGKVDPQARAEMPILPAGRMILKLAERSPEAAMEIIASARQNPKVAQLLSSTRFDELMKKFGGTMAEEAESSTMSAAQKKAFESAGREIKATPSEMSKVKALLFGE
jgi:hypothetical protein